MAILLMLFVVNYIDGGRTQDTMVSQDLVARKLKNPLDVRVHDSPRNTNPISAKSSDISLFPTDSPSGSLVRVSGIESFTCPTQPVLDAMQGADPDMCIPSSKTPSPMKIPETRDVTISPVKITSEVTKELQESITSLLRKRPTSEDDSVVKAGKRPRPLLRSKVYVCQIFMHRAILWAALMWQSLFSDTIATSIKRKFSVAVFPVGTQPRGDVRSNRC
jgi:hypothetical protein